MVAAVGLLGALVGAALGLSRVEEDQLPPGVEIGGVAVGRLSLAEARVRLEQYAKERISRRIVLRYVGGEIVISGQDLGATAGIESSLARALETRDRLSRLAARLGLSDTIQLPLEFTTDPSKVTAVLNLIRERVARKPVPASVVATTAEPEVIAAVTGVRLNGNATKQLLKELPAEVDLPLEAVEPRISTSDAEAARDVVAALVSDPPTIVHGKAQARLGAKIIRAALRFEPRRPVGRIEVLLDAAPLERRLRRIFSRYERKPRDASFAVAGKRVRLVPARRGRRLSVERTAAAIVANPSAAAVPALFDVATPTLTTAEAKELRIEERVSEFTTQYPCCAPRVTNIKLAARLLDGTIIPSGARFSLNQALGERTRERGFVPAPTIYDGRLQDDVGGGISQVATTLYNAAFFAGLELIAHTPHQFYISRYPMGREATVSWGGPELLFRNDWKAAILVKVTATDTAITVRFYSAELGRRVETMTGEPFDYREPQVIRELDPDLPAGSEVVVQEGGVRGFSVDYTRRVYRGRRLIRNEHYHVRYDPEDTVVEYAPRAPAGEG